MPGATVAGVAGDTGWESGSYMVTDASGATVDSGSYLSVSRKVNGKWLYVRDTYNSDRPLPAPPAAPEPAEEVKRRGSGYDSWVEIHHWLPHGSATPPRRSGSPSRRWGG